MHKPSSQPPDNRACTAASNATRMTAIAISFMVAILLMGAKFYTYRLTGSSAVLSDALESIINVVAAAFAMISVWLSAQPPDLEHPYGHGKIEYFSAGFEGALIILAAAGIFKTGIDRLLTPIPIENLNTGLLILLGTAVLNLSLGVILIRVGQREQSLTLIADGKHVLTDVYTSAGVVGGLFLVRLTNWLWVDGALARLVGTSILITGTRLVRQSYAALMDASDPELLDTISTILEQHRKPHWIDVHQLRAWRSGSFVHIDLHLMLPRHYRLDEAHADANALEKILIKHFGGKAGVLIHMDPCTSDECPICGQYDCPLRSHPPLDKTVWDRTSVTHHKAATHGSENNE
jgi:cation diffusion facilitator family transporter